MSENSKIEWTDHTFNPWEGCQKVGPGCDHCYAETRNARFGGGTAINWGPGAPRRRTSAANWRKPLIWDKREFFQCEDCGKRGFGVPWEDFGPNWGKVDDGHSCEACGSRSMEPVRMRVFCASLADVFDNAVDPSWREDLFSLIEKTPNLDWLLLTKRIGNVGNMLPVPFDFDRLYPNVWLGATVVNQEEADRDIPKLLALPAARRFLSMEPLLGPVDLTRIDIDGHREIYPLTGTTGCEDDDGNPTPNLPALDWVIGGGESGPGARPMHPEWIRDLRDQCAAAGAPFLFKQWGEWTPGENVKRTTGTVDTAFLSLDGMNWRVWPLNLKTDGGHIDDEPDLYRVGKKAAGRLLDGVQHDGFPA